MANSDKSRVTKRIDVDRRLTYGEMDENFQQLIYAIQDILNNENNLNQKVSQSVYDPKIAEIDDKLQTLSNYFSHNSGTTESRPTLDLDDVGFPYFDITLGHPIWWNGIAWVDHSGANV